MKREFEFWFSLPTKPKKWLAKLKLKHTLYFDEDMNCYTYERPDYYNCEYMTLRKNTIIYLYFEDEEGLCEDFKIVGKLQSGIPKIWYETLKDAIEDSSFDILEYTEQCKELYFRQVIDEE